jgi:hypothetical protein
MYGRSGRICAERLVRRTESGRWRIRRIARCKFESWDADSNSLQHATVRMRVETQMKVRTLESEHRV